MYTACGHFISLLAFVCIGLAVVVSASSLHQPAPVVSPGADVRSQADINQEADQFEEVLRKNRAKMEAASRELADWELETARARNEGTFFKGLFKADILQQPSAESRAPHQPELSAEVHMPTLRDAP